MSPSYRTASLGLIALLAVAGCASKGPYQTAVSEHWSSYGPVLSGDPPATSMDEIAAEAPTGPVVMLGTVRGVCQTKGCWMQVTPEGESQPMFVKFRDYGFFVPRNAAGRFVVIRGTPVYTEVSVEMLRHYAMDAGRTEAEILAITEPQRRVEFIADSVLIQGRGLETPYVAVVEENCEPEAAAETEEPGGGAESIEAAPAAAEVPPPPPPAEEPPLEEPVGAGLLEDPTQR